ncbi:Arylsulfatase A [Zhouia amylolytica]|uniref:Arylsulfatase A n=1 Tax=Zhouia amylolytica TaxID=376730 RepID=A0A1I6TX54_9FLAO|nr:sulfatase [Zhouia amylolytica]MCQ0111049.1 sulfatase [Zhouia amylolytica]SFS93755.1 Arylsulfatase A [Zhouia amylolytica]
MHKHFAVLALIFTVLNLTSCKTKEESSVPPPNIVWITSEDNSKHYMKLFDPHGVATPNIEKLAEQGLKFNHAFSNAPVCSVARSTIISGCYAPRTGTQFHRRMKLVPMPEQLQMFTVYLRAHGYYTTNNNKEDYNYIKGDSVWDESSKKASWKHRKPGQPFFHVQNIANTHEGSLHFKKEQLEKRPTITNKDSVFVLPNHPDSELFRYTNARYRDQIVKLDSLVGSVVNDLAQDGLLENTFIFYYGDHGGVLPGSKGYLYETGLHVPMVVYVPEKYQHLAPANHGSSIDGFVNFIDLAPTVLNLAGISIPEQIDGKPFMGDGVNLTELNTRDESFGYADRFDEKYDLVRSYRKGRFKYIRSYQPFNYDGLFNEYRYRQLAYQEWKQRYEEGTLNLAQAAFFESRPAELLFDLESDPYETKNLANDSAYQDTLLTLRKGLKKWVTRTPDLSFFPEFYLRQKAFDNPVAFGKKHQSDIETYIAIADYSLNPFEEVKSQLQTALKAKDPWKRYWALISCSAFGAEALSLAGTIENILSTDPELINKVRAAEFLGLTKSEDPAPVMTKALYESTDPVEALLIMNSITLMHDAPYTYDFNIDSDKLQPAVAKDMEIGRRIKYLKD